MVKCPSYWYHPHPLRLVIKSVVVSDFASCSNFIFISLSIDWYVQDGGLDVMADFVWVCLGLTWLKFTNSQSPGL